jgi:outer membrane biosynthesis protein TonB
MDFKRLAANQWITRIFLIVIIVLSGIVMYVVNQVDSIIHVQLYQYGLEYNPDWANPYWNYAKIINISLAATMGVSAIALLLDFIRPKPKLEGTIIKQEQLEPKTQPAPTPSPRIQAQPVIETPPKQQTPPATPQPQPTPQVQPQPKPEPQVQAPPPKPQPAPPVETVQEQKPKTSKQSKVNAKEANTCPSCRKAFTQPLVMLDFEGGKSKLVNVCPYCNQVLGDAEGKTD